MKYVIAIFSMLVTLSVSAAALTAADITPNTACGAPGVGYKGVVSSGIPLRIVEQTVPGQKVDAKGHWAVCKQPPDCASKKTHTWESANGSGRCTPNLSSIRYGKVGDKRTVIDRAWQGMIIYRCDTTGWVVDMAYCK